MLSPLQTRLLSRLHVAPIAAGGPLDAATSRRGLEARGYVQVDNRGRVHLTDAGRALFGAAFRDVAAHLSSVNHPETPTPETCLFSPFPAREIPTQYRLSWSPDRHQIDLARRQNRAPFTLIFSVSDLIGSPALVEQLRPHGAFFVRNRSVGAASSPG